MMRKPFIAIFICVVFYSMAVAQSIHNDSLLYRLAISTEDTSRVLIMTDLCLNYRLKNIDSSLYYGNRAVELANRIHFIRGEAIANGTIGLVLREKGDLSRSLELLLKALNISKENNLNAEVANNLRRIGLLYVDLKDYRKALDYIHQALKMNEIIGNKRKEISESMDLGNIYEQMNQLDSAMYFEQKAYDHISLIRDLAAELFFNLGNIEAKKGNNRAALVNYFQGIDAGLKNSDFRTLATIYTAIAQTYKVMKRPDSSIYYATNGIKYGQLASYKKGILLSSSLLAELYDSTDPKTALHYYKIGAEMKDSMFGAGNIQTIQTLIAREAERQKEAEAAKIAYQNRQKQYSLVAGLLAFLIIASVLYRNNRQKQKANNILENTLANLKSTQSQLIQSEKMASLGQLTAGIAHEIQNPLNFVNNFSEVNEELAEELKSELAVGNSQLAIEIANDIKDNSEKISHHGKRADAIVKGMLQHSQSGKGVKEQTDINALCDEYLKLSYHGLRAKDKNFNADFKTDFDNTINKINIIPQDIARVLLNLINNAFYAVNEKKKMADENYHPTISVETKKINNNVEIKVGDNGNGIPSTIINKIFQPFFTTKPTGHGTGLGLSLSYDIIKAHGGEIKVETKEGEGTTFIIQLPVV